MHKTILLLPFLLLPSLALAQINAQPLSEAEKQEKLARASNLKAQAAQLEKVADTRLKTETAACYKKFLVSSCLEDADTSHKKSVQEAKRLDLEGTEIERDIKRREVAIKDSRKETDAKERAYEQKLKGEQYRSDEEAKAEARAAKAAKKEQKAAEGRRKHAEAMARQQQKLEKRALEDAKRAEKRRAKEEAEAAKAAAKKGSAPTNP